MVRIFASEVAGETETCSVFEMRAIELEILESCFWNYFWKSKPEFLAQSSKAPYLF